MVITRHVKMMALDMVAVEAGLPLGGFGLTDDLRTVESNYVESIAND